MLLVAAFPNMGRAAANVAVDNILVSKTNGISNVQLWPACRMRYVDHSPFGSGLEVRVRVSIGPDCDAVIGEVISERYAPPSLHLANVDEIVFEQLNPRDVFITFRFKEPQKFEVRQHTVGWIELHIDTTADSKTLSAATATPLPRAVSPQPPESSLRSLRSPPPRPSSSTNEVQRSSRATVPPSSSGDFVVQLGVFDNAARAEQALLASATPYFAYRTELLVNGHTWNGLQLGFFDSEAAAERVVDELRDRFPDAWVRYVDPHEASLAKSNGDVRSVTDSAATAVAVRPETRISPDQMTSLMADGRQALLENRYKDAIRIYTRVLEVADHQHRAEAREMLGIAFERDQKTAHAIAEFKGFLDEFPSNLGAARVNERLNALTTASLTQAPTLHKGVIQDRQRDGWEIHGGLSHYYWRNQDQVVHEGNYLVSSSGVLGLGDVTATRRGERFDVLARMNGAYQHNLVEFDRSGDVGWVSDAFVDVLDTKLGLQGRVGRQTRRTDGVLGRFDGIGLRYQWKPDISFSASTGIPIDSPRYFGDSDRFFYAASASVEDLLDGRVTASAFTHQQTVDGISDRQAVGGELLYRGESISVFSLLDFDASYNVLNSLLINATWQLVNDWSVSGRVDFGAEPFLTTRNALSGQAVGSVEALLNSFSEGQVRRLARDKTTQATSVSLGLSAPLGEYLDLSLDATMRHADASVESGGVVARTDTGNEIFFNATMVATSLFKDNDLLLVSLRYDALQSRDSVRVMIDSRLPLSRSLRLSPRLVLTHREAIETSETQTIVNPSMRLMIRWGGALLDFEAGGRWSNRELPLSELDPFTPDGTEELRGGYVNIGYRWEF